MSDKNDSFLDLGPIANKLRKRVGIENIARKRVIEEIILAIREISAKHHLNMFELSVILPELVEVFLKNSELDTNDEWLNSEQAKKRYREIYNSKQEC